MFFGEIGINNNYTGPEDSDALAGIDVAECVDARGRVYVCPSWGCTTFLVQEEKHSDSCGCGRSMFVDRESAGNGLESDLATDALVVVEALGYADHSLSIASSIRAGGS